MSVSIRLHAQVILAYYQLGMSRVEISVTEYSTTENRFDHEYSMLTKLPANFLSHRLLLLHSW